MAKKRAQKAKLIKELEENSIVSVACMKIGISRATYYRWRAEDVDFKAATTRASEIGRAKFNDLAESKLLENIKANNQQAIAYWLRFNHKNYRPQVLRLVIEENKQQRIDLANLTMLLDELINHVGVEKLIDTAVADPKAFKEKLKNEVNKGKEALDEL